MTHTPKHAIKRRRQQLKKVRRQVKPHFWRTVACVTFATCGLVVNSAPVSMSIAPVTPEQRLTMEPSTVEGFQSMFDQVPTSTWGGADVSLSRRLDDNRVLWLYGDTLSSTHYLVHSTALIQDGSELRVLNNGRQLIPDDKDGTIYWIEDAQVEENDQVTVIAAPMKLGLGGQWDFKRADERSRVGVLTISKNDVTFDRWIGWTTAPEPFADLHEHPNGRYTYETRSHPEFKLKDGRCLSTTNQNWKSKGQDDFKKDRNGKVVYKDYRPVFSSTPECGRA